jgi:hypothetical protein
MLDDEDVRISEVPDVLNKSPLLVPYTFETRVGALQPLTLASAVKRPEPERSATDVTFVPPDIVNVLAC